ncbi:hypothetical protein Rumeso_04370 [Rubellimicrobium mesophilum DSM 19309]|uniref:Uncharacterized protein n=1 Tax=Rubellimicrobium mesophilum DSM 19309 TaxID=442562 RepID=A0A017HIB4_9RHOB|nr:hypothetical protein Rumeso_04370 [Rubellimicrobium mesophilum DSM 19309]
MGEGAQGAAYDKLAVEQVYAAALENVAVLRLPAVYGWPDQSRIEAYAGPMLDGVEEIALHPRLAGWRFARVLNRNAGHAVALAALGDWSGFCAWNVAEPVSPTEAQWVARIGQAVGWRGQIVESDAVEPPGFDADQPIILSDARIRSELGYHERHDPEQGLRDAVRRYAEFRARKS